MFNDTHFPFAFHVYSSVAHLIQQLSEKIRTNLLHTYITKISVIPQHLYIYLSNNEAIIVNLNLEIE